MLVAEDGTIIAGHGRVLAAQKLGIKDVPVMVAAGWTEAQRRAYTIADNKLTLNGSWDDELLGLEIGELEVLGFDLDLIGFSDDERAALAAHPTEGLTDPDVVPDLPSNPVTRTSREVRQKSANDPHATVAVHCDTVLDASFSLYQSTRLNRYDAVS